MVYGVELGPSHCQPSSPILASHPDIFTVLLELSFLAEMLEYPTT